ncbi:MAG: polymer-forming cytoskeletal protein [Spirochaetales bacterium]|jgi:cytoskeletal protein CcmA (bactofilin family)|nr:polymer-forming cytoskeletal protein [Spirochaetales bacterium]
MARDFENGKDKNITTLGEGTDFTGVLRFGKSLRIQGKFTGEIQSGDFLYIDANALVKANIKVRCLIVGGVVRGDITAGDFLEIREQGQVYGNIKTSRLRIADGVIFEGKCEMIRDAESVDIFSGEADKLKQMFQPLGYYEKFGLKK